MKKTTEKSNLLALIPVKGDQVLTFISVKKTTNNLVALAKKIKLEAKCNKKNKAEFEENWRALRDRRLVLDKMVLINAKYFNQQKKDDKEVIDVMIDIIKPAEDSVKARLNTYKTEVADEKAAKAKAEEVRIQVIQDLNKEANDLLVDLMMKCKSDSDLKELKKQIEKYNSDEFKAKYQELEHLHIQLMMAAEEYEEKAEEVIEDNKKAEKAEKALKIIEAQKRKDKEKQKTLDKIAADKVAEAEKTASDALKELQVFKDNQASQKEADKQEKLDAEEMKGLYPKLSKLEKQAKKISLKLGEKPEFDKVESLRNYYNNSVEKISIEIDRVAELEAGKVSEERWNKIAPKIYKFEADLLQSFNDLENELSDLTDDFLNESLAVYSEEIEEALQTFKNKFCTPEIID